MSNATSFTSRLSYLQVQTQLSGKRREVYDAIRDWSGDGLPCNDDIAEETGMRLSSVCGRVSELRELGAIEDAPMKESPITGQKVKTYRAIVYREATESVEPQTSLFPETLGENTPYTYH